MMNVPEPLNAQPNLTADVQEQINAAIAQVEAKYSERVKTLETELESRRNTGGPPSSGLAQNAGGPEYERAPVWGMIHQELARAGKLTDEILSAVGLIEKV
jgi:hypothetical protein